MNVLFIFNLSEQLYSADTENVLVNHRGLVSYNSAMEWEIWKNNPMIIYLCF